MGIDAQGRVCLPGALRADLGIDDAGAVVHITLDHLDRILIFPRRDAISAYARDLAKDTPGIREVDMVEFLFFSRTTGTVDARGRIALSEPMREAAGLDGETWVVATDCCLILESSDGALERHAKLKRKLLAQVETT